MNTMGRKVVLAILIAASMSAFCISRSFGGEEIDRTLDQMTNMADTICSGKIDQYELLQESSEVYWPVFRCSVDYVIKGNLSTNIILLHAGARPYRTSDVKLADMSNAVVMANEDITKRESRKTRLLFFVKTIDSKKNTFEQIGITLVAPIPPVAPKENMGSEEQIELELVEALKVLDPKKTPQEQFLLRTWSRQTEAITNALDQLKIKPK